MAQDFKLEAERHAIAQAPEESCGLVVNSSYFPCRNIAPEPTKSFVINPVDYARAMLVGKIEAIVHSHPLGTPISDYDRNASRHTNLPWYVYSVPDQRWLITGN